MHRRLSISALVVSAVLAVTFAVAGSASALVRPDLTVQILTGNADLVVKGTVTAVRTAMGDWPGVDHEIPLTHVTLSIGETMKGTPSLRTVEFVIPGGEVPGVARVEVSDTPEVFAGEEILVFLTKQNKTGHNIVFGWSHGKFRVERNARGEELLKSELNRNVADGFPLQRVREVVHFTNGVTRKGQTAPSTP